MFETVRDVAMIKIILKINRPAKSSPRYYTKNREETRRNRNKGSS